MKRVKNKIITKKITFFVLISFLKEKTKKKSGQDLGISAVLKPNSMFFLMQGHF